MQQHQMGVSPCPHLSEKEETLWTTTDKVAWNSCMLTGMLWEEAGNIKGFKVCHPVNFSMTRFMSL